MSSDVKWSNLATAEPLCACMLERAMAEETALPPFVTEPFVALIHKTYAALYTESGDCVRHGQITNPSS